MRTLLVATLAFAFLGAEVARSKIYRWTDAQGRIHFTQSLDQVPPQHREAARAAAEAAPTRRVQVVGSDDPVPASRAARLRAGRSHRIPFRRQGEVMIVDVRLNDRMTAPFIVDTGASGVSLPKSVADRLGLRVRPNTPRIYVRTANGVASRAVVGLDSVQVGPARVEDLEATVNPTMEIGLLGGSFFNNFVYRVDAAESVITLSPNERIRGGLRADEWRQRFRDLREPLMRLEAHLETTQLTDEGRVVELEQHRLDLRRRLEELESEANRVGVPRAWRE